MLVLLLLLFLIYLFFSVIIIIIIIIIIIDLLLIFCGVGVSDHLLEGCRSYRNSFIARARVVTLRHKLRFQ